MNSEKNVITLNAERKFTLDEVNELLPLVYRITEGSQKEVKSLMNMLDALKESVSERKQQIETEINEIVARWQLKVSKLGAHPKGLWLADFDFGEGYYCWKFPETEIKFWHGYHDGFSGRKSVHPN